MPPSPLVSRWPAAAHPAALAFRQLDVRLADRNLLPRFDHVGPLGQRAPHGGVDVRRRPRRRNDVGRLEPRGPEIRAVRVEHRRPQDVLGLERSRARDDQVLAPLRDFRPGGDEIERRRLADVDAGTVGSLELEREVERALLHADRAHAPTTRFQ